MPAAGRCRRWRPRCSDRAAVARLIKARPDIGAKLLVKLTQRLAQRLRNTSGQLVKVAGPHGNVA